ncbi:S-layer homology domain-containing protein [Candidatus Peregrinibacteria bacterium]|nr:S-layer homology domain-containing protein [Candidatus Peregrinibacteria bacterium]
MSVPRNLLCFFLAMTLLAPPFALGATGGTFKDLKPSDFGYDSAVDLQSRNIMKGFSNGTFRPNLAVNRAEAIKIIAEPLITPEEEKATQSTSFSDIDSSAWYVPSVEWAVKKKLIQGPPAAKAFHATRPVTKAEFLKMLFLAYGVDPNSYSEVQLPLSKDVTDPKAWYFPFFRYGISSSVVVAPRNGILGPSRSLTRIDVAVLLDRFLQYKSGARTQALLDLSFADLLSAQDALSKSNMKEAEPASARALLAARGALAVTPDSPAVKIAVKISEAMRALVKAYRAATVQDRTSVITFAKNAWDLAEQAKKFSPSATAIAQQIQKYARNFADTARKGK